MSKVEEFIAETKLNDLLHKKEAESQKNKVIWVLAIIGAVAAVAGIAYAVYRFFTPDYLEEFEDDFDSVPAIISNMKVNIGLCLVGVIIGEFLAAKSGLGYLIIYSSQVFKMDWLLMSIILLCIMAMGLYALINVVEKRVLKKY